VSPAERLRALELSGDPDAREIARTYKASPVDPKPAMRQMFRSSQVASNALRPTYARATDADADEAEESVAAKRAQREREREIRDQQLHEFARSGEQREAAMLRLTWASVVITLVSLATSTAALYVAISSS
jgi:hypothetical protein